jgi:hypothetical protein
MELLASHEKVWLSYRGNYILFRSLVARARIRTIFGKDFHISPQIQLGHDPDKVIVSECFSINSNSKRNAYTRRQET